MATNISPFIEEIDLRQELVDLFTGNEFVNKMRAFIYRRPKKDDKGNKVRCHCYDNVSNEGKSDCPDCAGAGYLWNEEILLGHMWMPRNIIMTDSSGYVTTSQKLGRSLDSRWVLVIPFPVKTNERDIIYLPEVDDEGRIKFPIRVDKSFYITEASRTGFDYGRRDFTTIGLMAR